MKAGPEPLRSSALIRAVLREGRAAHRETLVVHAQTRTGGGPGRAAVLAGRKVGGAVQRNRAKRRLRAALAAVALPAGTDLVVVARARSLDAPFSALVGDLRSAVGGDG